MKTRVTIVLTLLLVAVLLFPCIGNAQQTEVKSNSAPQTSEKLKYKNIQAEFDATYDFLSDIGEMIDNARHQKDGVDLLACAQLLLLAEKSSGKKSTIITSDALFNEIIELVKEQKNSKLAKMLADFYTTQGNKTKADEMNKLAKDYEKLESGTRGYCWVRVNNYSSWTIDIYIDGKYKGTVSPGYYSYFKIWEGYTKLFGAGTYTDYTWGPIYRDIGEDETFTWNLYD